MILNGVSTADLGLTLTTAAPPVSGFARARTSTAVPGLTGHIAARVSIVPPRVLTFVVLGWQTMTTAERATLLARISALGTGVIEVQSPDDRTRRLVGLVTRNDATVASPSFVNVAPEITLEITCYNAALEDVEPLQFAIGTTPVRMPVGTAGHTAQFLLSGANATPFTITYRDFAGVIRGQITGTPALLSNGALVIDTASEQWVQYTGGVGVLVPTWNTTGDTWPAFVPRHAQREMQQWATLESTVTMGVTYRRNWES